MKLSQMLFRACAIALFAAPFVACTADDGSPGPTGTPVLRGALFDTIIARTERREAFSPIKNERLGFNPLAAMRALREDVVAADTETELYYALARLSHARRDRHLDLFLVPGGLTLPDSAGLDVARGPDPAPPGQAPVRVFPDYSEGAAPSDYFVGVWPPGHCTGRRPRARAGPRISSVPGSSGVNGMSVAEWHDSAAAFMRHSTHAALRWKLAEAMALSTAALPRTCGPTRSNWSSTRTTGRWAPSTPSPLWTPAA